MRLRHLVALLTVVLAAVALTSCGDDDDDGAAGDTTTTAATDGGAAGDGGSDDGDPAGAVAARLDAIEVAVGAWRDAATIEDAHAAAEEARNLVVGPDVPLHGDADGDGSTAGAVDVGLVPGASGVEGLASAVPSDCLERDVLGGSWDDPQARWDELAAVLDEWAPTSNTMPRLASHPMRIVGWATLTLETDDLDEAHEFAGHAMLHVTVSVDALATCA